MKYLVLITLLLIPAIVIAAAACPESLPGYARSYRPVEVPPNYPPADEPLCLYYTTSGGQP